MYDAGNDLAPSKKKPLIKPKATIEKIPPQPDLTQEKKSIETLGVNVTTTHGAKEVRQELEQKQTKKADLVSAQTPNEQETPRFSSKV